MTQSPRDYVLEPIRDGAEFTLHRARQRDKPMPLLVAAPTMEPPPPQSLRRLEHEYTRSQTKLEPSWAAKPLALTRYEGRTILGLADPGGEPLDRILERDREAISGTTIFARGARSGGYMQLNDGPSRRFGVVSEKTLPRIAAVHRTRYAGECRL